MLEFFKDTFAELRGIDMIEKKKSELEKMKKEKSERIILSRKMKITLRIVGGFSLFWLGLSVYLWAQEEFTPMIFKYIFMFLLAISGLILTFIRSKKSEIALIICAITFVLVSMIFT